MRRLVAHPTNSLNPVPTTSERTPLQALPSTLPVIGPFIVFTSHPCAAPRPSSRRPAASSNTAYEWDSVWLHLVYVLGPSRHSFIQSNSSIQDVLRGPPTPAPHLAPYRLLLSLPVRGFRFP